MKQEKQEWQPPPAPAIAAPSPAVFLSHGRKLMGNAKKDHLLQWAVVARLHSLFGLYQNSNLISLSVLTIHIDCLYLTDVHVYHIIIQRR
jgi:hypothetical protein